MEFSVLTLSALMHSVISAAGHLGMCSPMLYCLLVVCSDEKEEEEYEKEEVGEDGEIILVSGERGEKGPWNKSGAAPPPAPVGE